MTWVGERRLSNGVVLWVEFERNGVADSCGDIGWVVSKQPISTNGDLMVDWLSGWGGRFGGSLR